MKVTDNETRWAKIGEIKDLSFIGKEVVFYGTGCHLIFINLSTSEELLYTANNAKVGDGIQCFNGHRTSPVFAFAEKKTNPTLFIKSYPNFDEIHQFKDGAARGYIAVAFSETSLLITLGDLPDFNITAWNWRRHEKIASQNGTILMQNQALRCNLTSPVFLAQMGLHSNKLHVWDIFVCGKKCILTQHVVRIEENCSPFTGIVWTTEGGLFVLDASGSIYTMFPDHHLEKVIDSPDSGPYPTSFTWYKFGLAVAGPNLEIRHYKKSGTWTMDWSLVPPQPIQKIQSRFDYLIAITTKFDLIQVMPTQNDFKYVKINESQFDDFCLVYPTGEYLLALTHNHMVNSYKVATGEMMGTIELDGTATVIVENPKFPYAAVGFESGILNLVSAYNPQKLTKMTQFFLTKHPTNSIRFNECGTVFVVGHLTIGRFFVVEGIPGGQMEVIALIDAQRQIADYTIVISQDCYRIFMLPVTSDQFIAGNMILRYCYIKNKGTDVKEYFFEEKNTLFVRMVATTGVNRDRLFYLIPLEGKTISEVEIKKSEILAKITKHIITGHQMQNIYFRLDKKIALTWGYDGFVIARGADFETNIGIGLPHHRMQGGVKKAYLGPHQKYMITLGRDTVLACTNLMERRIDSKLKQEFEDTLNSDDYKLLFTRRTLGYFPRGIYEGKCYLEVQEMKKIEKEYLQCKKERDSILAEFRSIQKELQELLTANLEGPDNEKLDMKEFNLNTTLYNQKAEFNRKLKKATELYLKNLIQAQNMISNYMVTNFWDKMKVPGAAIKAIFANFEVTNYVLRPPDLNREEVLNWIRHQRRIERYLSEMNSFHPWEPMPEDKLLELVSTRPSLPIKDEHLAVLSALEIDAPEIEVEEEDFESKIAFSGSDTARFIEVQDAHYLQNELQTYFQTELQWIISKSDSYKLKEFFNEKYEKVMLQKMKEMTSIKQKNERLRHIVSEINYFSDEKIYVNIDDPHWEQVETPELLTQVKDCEVPVTPYISPSEQAILDAKAAEAERLRLLLLADDFRERALMAMMNGVLEVRWEDELRKEVPLPKCMIEKEPENFNEDDLRAVRDYEDKVQFLNSERERYKSLLRAEYAKLAKSVRENIKKFNNKLSELLHLRLEVDAAISHESLRVTRIKLFQYKRKLLFQKEQEILQKIANNDEVVASLHKLMTTLHEAVSECRNCIESYQVKEKYLERAFKKDFQDLSIVVQEQATKLLKKRPKINHRLFSSVTILNELSKCIILGTKSMRLNQEALDFLKQLDNLDLYVGVPTIIDEHTYAVICKHRRLRIEYEVKLKAAQSELTEAETTSAAFHKRLHHKKELGAKLHNDLNDVRQELMLMMCNGDVQIVLPRGLVEIPLSGSMSDYEDAVLICRKDVEEINRIILEFGGKKIKALELGMNFRRRILTLEWEHKRRRMLIQDLQEKIIDIDGVRLTKEIQFYLKSKDKEKAIPFDTEVDMIKASYENTIQDRKDKVNRMQKQINAIKAHDKLVEKKITELNVDVCEFNLVKDDELDVRERAMIDARMKTLLTRSRLVQQIQDNHHEILMLQTELELLRLKTFPTLKYKLC
ncbi:cilia- and flagella-associated protein 43 [Tribolium madens]|uniref:cilia- and flagella-associated protein 43 n=1 Tax=Tribolium madens TaxID=41895 RepID=UPI001CF75DA7|nr:cilia- and flagella-associated protein 43 [Tribolium madens]